MNDTLNYDINTSLLMRRIYFILNQWLWCASDRYLQLPHRKSQLKPHVNPEPPMLLAWHFFLPPIFAPVAVTRSLIPLQLFQVEGLLLDTPIWTVFPFLDPQLPLYLVRF